MTDEIEVEIGYEEIVGNLNQSSVRLEAATPNAAPI